MQRCDANFKGFALLRTAEESMSFRVLSLRFF